MNSCCLNGRKFGTSRAPFLSHLLNDCFQGFFERELKKSDVVIHEPTGIEESPAPRDIVDLEVTFSSDMLSLHFKVLFYFINIVTAALLTTLCTLNRECS